MPAIWLLSTRGRPDACQEVLDACEATGMTSPGVVYVDETVDQYRNLRLPKNWRLHGEREWGSLQASLQWCFRNYPDASAYGWLADDTIPATRGWDKRLETAAGDWGVSYARDLWLSESTSAHELEDGDNLSSGLCFAGPLVRTVGWWALPGVRQAGIDTAWTAVIGPLGLGRYTRDVIVEHRNWRTGKRERDDVDDWARNGADYVENDIAVRDRWVASADYRATLTRVAHAADVTLTEKQLERLRRFLVDSFANEVWRPGGVCAARLQNAVDKARENLDQTVADLLGYHPHERAS